MVSSLMDDFTYVGGHPAGIELRSEASLQTEGHAEP